MAANTAVIRGLDGLKTPWKSSSEHRHHRYYIFTHFFGGFLVKFMNLYKVCTKKKGRMMCAE
jgi:hypothetical protein